jgi:hypothetical protein
VDGRDGGMDLVGWVEWTDVRMDGDRMQAEMHAYGHAHSHAGKRQARITNSAHAPVRPLSGNALCHMCRILWCGNRRTGAHRQREPIDRGDGISGIFDEEVDAADDCVPVAPSRVAFKAQTAPVGLVRDDRRALAGHLVVDTKKARRADTSGHAQRECCKNNQTEAELG